MREDVGFRRGFDGRVEVRRRGAGLSPDDPRAWLEVRPDLGVPGTLLLRDAADGGRVWYLSVPRVQQVDLTDDFAVAAVFAGGAWERAMQPLQAPAEQGGEAERAGLKFEDVRLDREAFRALTTVA
jgi:hypothetical protein